ncbi:hypothetical protein CRG98_039860 [Punica granatum]|uniref:Uncharacterized protein n=1 Tax=Punica granatum TaxID=22663 RepID=A0A2I0I745_PUNGR|nr:hypothetical protein CRG98_039860 [Punica granatum]
MVYLPRQVYKAEEMKYKMEDNGVLFTEIPKEPEVGPRANRPLIKHFCMAERHFRFCQERIPNYLGSRQSLPTTKKMVRYNHVGNDQRWREGPGTRDDGRRSRPHLRCSQHPQKMPASLEQPDLTSEVSVLRGCRDHECGVGPLFNGPVPKSVENLTLKSQSIQGLGVSSGGLDPYSKSPASTMDTCEIEGGVRAVGHRPQPLPPLPVVVVDQFPLPPRSDRISFSRSDFVICFRFPQRPLLYNIFVISLLPWSAKKKQQPQWRRRSLSGDSSSVALLQGLPLRP